MTMCHLFPCLSLLLFVIFLMETFQKMSLMFPLFLSYSAAHLKFGILGWFIMTNYVIDVKEYVLKYVSPVFIQPLFCFYITWW